MCRALINAWNRLAHKALASAMQNVLLKIISESRKFLDYHSRSFGTDSAVSGVINTLGCLLDNINRLNGSCTVENRLQQLFELSEANAARCAFTAGL